MLAINAASAALMLSGLPFEGPIGAVRLAYNGEGEWVPHPTYQEGDESAFELVIAGRQLEDGDVAIMMVEAGGTESAWQLFQSGAPQGHRGGDRGGPRSRPRPGSGRASSCNVSWWPRPAAARLWPSSRRSITARDVAERVARSAPSRSTKSPPSLPRPSARRPRTRSPAPLWPSWPASSRGVRTR